MLKAALDTSVVIAALLSWHQDHQAALTCIQRLFSEKVGIVLPTRVLIESLSVMTRMPAPQRVASEDALQLLSRTFEGKAELVDQPADTYWQTLRDIVDNGATGGMVYDAEIIECAYRAGAEMIFTLNKRHFDRLARPSITVVSPYEK